MGQLLQFMGLCHTATILSRETKVALLYLSSIAPKFFTARSRVVRQSFCSLSGSLRSRRLKVVGTRKNGCARRRHSRDRPSRARSLFHPLLPNACYAGYSLGTIWLPCEYGPLGIGPLRPGCLRLLSLR